MKLTPGRIVLYKLSGDDAEQINRRRTNSASIADRLSKETWPRGAQAHIGNEHRAGDVVPVIVVHVWPDEYGPGFEGFNGQAFLDGNDTLWVTSIKEGPEQGQWMWPER